jgi:GntR family transcriptional repressor for pyruvate dehydrogenase complex
MSWTPELIHSRRTFEEAVDQIEFAILTGALGVGDRLPSERNLATAMGISRPTVREAIRVLADAGAVEVRPGAGGGVVVKSEVVSKSVHAGVAAAVGNVGDVLEARRLFEPQVAQLAGIFASEDDFRRLRDTIGKQRDAVGDRERTNRLDEQFHVSIAVATGNPVVLRMMRTLLRRLSIAGDMDYRSSNEPERGITAHEETLAAIMARDPIAIDIAMDRHLSILEGLWEGAAGRPRLRRAGVRAPGVARFAIGVVQ